MAPLLVGACGALGLAASPALAASQAPAGSAQGQPAHSSSGEPGPGVSVGPVTEVSKGCGGQNAEVEQATAPPDYVYEAWIGCGGEGFARSVDGGAHFSKPIHLPDSGGSDDPAVAVSPSGVVYVSYLRYHDHYGYPVVATSFDHGATFKASSLIPPVKNNWGDRDFIAAGRNGTVYVTWDYGPSAADLKYTCAPDGSCAYSAVDATAVIQKSTNYGKTWGPITPMEPGFPAGGGYFASTLVQPNGVIDALILNHPLTPGTFKVHPGQEYFTSSSDGGKTWSPMVEVGGSVGTLSDTEWWIDGDLSIDRAGILYATWDSQPSSGSDIGWLSYSTDHGRTWSAPVRVTPDNDGAMHDVEVVGTGPGTADVGWQSDNSPKGYATYLRPFSIRHGWLAPVTRVSRQYGQPKIWPGDTFGLSVLPGSLSPFGPQRIPLSWGSAVSGSKNSGIYSAVARLRRP
ncbi:MAG: exo-alpha-sialidase [Nocardiopsaceae bacterium]|nr:exo-alpha-sialidase [Nocardiopsaceae bacterium]